jgi:hypothetical protein
MSAKFRNVVFFQALLMLMFATGATQAQSQTDSQVAKATSNTNTATSSAQPAPVFNEYHGVKIGMAVKEVRSSVDRYLKAKGEQQDFLVLSENETAQIFYDDAHNVTAISIDYSAKHDHAPTAMEVLGADVEPKADGSIYALKRYPAAGYWVSYNRTSGDSPTVTVTMQALR